ncbi:MAG: hypothetical protein ACOVSW_18395 [Candidatus Kapaibacteriota bacterium]
MTAQLAAKTRWVTGFGQGTTFIVKLPKSLPTIQSSSPAQI